MKFLIICTGSTSRLMLSTPLVRCLRQQVAGAQIEYLARQDNSMVLASNPYIHRLYNAEQVTLQILKDEAFDHIIDLQQDAFSRNIIRQLGKPSSTYKNHSFRTGVYTRLKWNLMPKDFHVATQFMEAAAPWGVKYDGAGLDFFIDPAHEISERDIPASHHLGYIAIVIGGSKLTRRMLPDKIRAICKAIDHPLMLIGGREDFDRGEDIAAFDPVKVYNACGKFNLDESAALLKRARLVISHDTGMMQVAAALKKPVIAVWGSTTPSLGRAPFYGQAVNKIQLPYDDVQVHGLWCRPCTVEGKSSCPQGHFKCMKKISVEEITGWVKKILAKQAPRQNSNSRTEG